LIIESGINMQITQARDRLFHLLYEKSFIYRENPPFVLVSGRESPYYFNCKATTLDPEGCYLVGEVVFHHIEDLSMDAIGGLTLGSDPISLSTSLVALKNGVILHPLIIRKEPKQHGTQKWIEGNVEKAKRVIVVDDVITTGGSTIKAIEKMREAGLEIVKAVVIIDREEGGRENIERMSVEVHSLFTRADFDRERLKRG